MIKLVERLILQDKVDFILGAANTPATIAIAQVVQDAKVVQLSDGVGPGERLAPDANPAEAGAF